MSHFRHVGFIGFALGQIGFMFFLVAGCEPTEDKKAADEVPTVRAAECRWAAGKIKIEGETDEVAWDKAQELSDFAVFWEKRKPKTATKAKLLWDDNFFYFTAEMEDADLYADITDHNGMIWHNDVFEIFLKPVKDKPAYYEFQVNAANAQLELFFPSRGAGGYQRFAPLTKFGMESAVKLRGTLNNWKDKDEGWTVEGRIPWTAFKETGGKPETGDKWWFALCRYDYSVAFERVETSSTAPLNVADFHRYEDYGTLTFVGPKD
jgi:hypothetical protein